MLESVSLCIFYEHVIIRLFTLTKCETEQFTDVGQLDTRSMSEVRLQRDVAAAAEGCAEILDTVTLTDMSTFDLISISNIEYQQHPRLFFSHPETEYR